MGRVDRGAKVRPEIQLGLPEIPSQYLQRFTFDTIVPFEIGDGVRD
jgi:hypothetical protein